jgi:hypothetical protein
VLNNGDNRKITNKLSSEKSEMVDSYDRQELSDKVDIDNIVAIAEKGKKEINLFANKSFDYIKNAQNC